MTFVRCALALGLPLIVADCSERGPAPCDLEVENQPAIFDLSCGPTNVMSVTLSGACATDDTNPSHYVFGPTSKSIAVRSPNPGDCHVVLTFATGFTFSADVTFTSELGGCAPNSYTAPTPQTHTVDNPSDTCVLDAGSAPDGSAAGGAPNTGGTGSSGAP